MPKENGAPDQGAQPNEFAALLGELDTFSKAMSAPDKGKDVDADAGGADGGSDAEDNPAGDKKIQAAAADGEANSTADDDNDAEDGDAFGKSFTVELEDGSKVEAYDGTAMMKALKAENDALGAKVTAQAAALAESGRFAKALLGQVKSQGELLKSLQADLRKIGSQGAGRRTAITVHEKTATGGAPAQGGGVTRQEFMAKAMTAVQGGKLSSIEAARIDSYVARGMKPPADLVAKVMS